MPQGQFEVHSNGRREFIDLSGRIRTIVSESGMQDGLLVLHNPHTTAGLTINEGADADVQKDILNTLARMAPDAAHYRHLEGNSPAHVMATITGSSVSVIIHQGQIQLGTWQRIFFCEFDGPRHRTLRWLLLADR
mgnify:CR=1 FL=1